MVGDLVRIRFCIMGWRRRDDLVKAWRSRSAGVVMLENEPGIVLEETVCPTNLQYTQVLTSNHGPVWIINHAVESVTRR